MLLHAHWLLLSHHAVADGWEHATVTLGHRLLLLHLVGSLVFHRAATVRIPHRWCHLHSHLVHLVRLDEARRLHPVWLHGRGHSWLHLAVSAWPACGVHRSHELLLTVVMDHWTAVRWIQIVGQRWL